jgi:hypothetical protein
MSDANLLVAGCVVSFIALAGFYVYLRQCFTDQALASEDPDRSSEQSETRLRDVA